MQNNSFKLSRESMIVATVIVSESEIKKVMPEFHKGLQRSDPYAFGNIMYMLGVDINKGVVHQEGLKHRNRLNEVVTCSRWVGQERQDDEWISSGYASREAIDKHSGNRILEDIYRAKMLTTDTQATLEERDKYSKIDESAWE